MTEQSTNHKRIMQQQLMQRWTEKAMATKQAELAPIFEKILESLNRIEACLPVETEDHDFFETNTES